jgi:hypothetical protein
VSDERETIDLAYIGRALQRLTTEVGGNPPRHHGRSNIIRMRRFGVRDLTP